MCWWGTFRLITVFFCLPTTSCVHWPSGKYGLPKATSGCPSSYGFRWKTGWRLQDTNDGNSKNNKSDDFHLDGEVDNKKVNRSFCIKKNVRNQLENSRPFWPSGKYCVYKKGSQCPSGLGEGYVYWDDDDFGNLNDESGILPSGEYNEDTKVEFCCQTNGNKKEPILLPTELPFFLLAFGSDECQMVKWAIATLEWIYYDTEDWSNNDFRARPYPYDAGINHPTIYYCYYHGCNKTMSGVKGTFHSPNYPNKYPDGQYCSWRITVSPGQRIHLMFTAFSLQSENNTDALTVFDAQNDTGELLGVFYGQHPPPVNGINSSSNHLFIIFKSDETDSSYHTGFNATYSAVYKSDVIPTQEVASTTAKTFLTSSTKTTSDMGVTATTVAATKDIGNKDQRNASQAKGLNTVAVVVPLVALLFLVALLVAGFVFCKRRRTKKQGQGTPKEVVFSRSNSEGPRSVENPYYSSDMVIVNTACSSDDNGLYTNVREDRRIDKGTCKRHESEKPFSSESEVYSNVAKDHLSDKKTCELRKIAENELYTNVEEDRRIDEETCKQPERESPRPCESEVYSNVMEKLRDDKNRHCQEKLAENELYTEVEEDERINKETHNKEESENPLYESATSEE